jgi:hypothetical protein
LLQVSVGTVAPRGSNPGAPSNKIKGLMDVAGPHVIKEPLQVGYDLSG